MKSPPSSGPEEIIDAFDKLFADLGVPIRSQPPERKPGRKLRLLELLIMGVCIAVPVGYYLTSWLARGIDGATCKTNSDCRSSLCLFKGSRSISLPDMPRVGPPSSADALVCTSECEQDEDCPIWMTCGWGQLSEYEFWFETEHHDLRVCVLRELPPRTGEEHAAERQR